MTTSPVSATPHAKQIALIANCLGPDGLEIGTFSTAAYINSIENNARPGEPVKVVVIRPDPHIDDSDFDAIADTYDGFVFTGGRNNVDPALYGSEEDKLPGTHDRAQDNFKLILMDRALKKGKPVLGICLGAQLLYVLLGGTLFQNLNEIHDFHNGHRPPDYIQGAERFNMENGLGHSIIPIPGSLFEWLAREAAATKKSGDINDVKVMSSGLLEVLNNSVHRQGMAYLPKGVVVQAVSKVKQRVDGLIEAFRLGADHPEYSAHPYAVGIQSHPEKQDSPFARVLFQSFNDAVWNRLNLSREAAREEAPWLKEDTVVTNRLLSHHYAGLRGQNLPRRRQASGRKFPPRGNRPEAG